MRPVALAFMEQGIDIICEKPLTAALSEVAELQAAQQSSGVFFGLAYAYASHPMVRQAKAMVEAGDLGRSASRCMWNIFRIGP
jgi:predicted dehydrogenase